MMRMKHGSSLTRIIRLSTIFNSWRSSTNKSTQKRITRTAVLVCLIVWKISGINAGRTLRKITIVPTQLYPSPLYTRSLTGYSASAREKTGGNAEEPSSPAP
ncbi:uncharacterized protein EKO05_0005094 [Ascochyta rabiei]|uniref:uncharacterized protein n=1 Tax=Didymella rabiei TaxID=5454 RepID=UPI0021FC7377|nr:uncharacterized protein EKO05_0005094 [Ascochyta rabiei]UPX14617.1 hypothetical protein EKO05_0005094 [Ascochyta rabiei]